MTKASALPLGNPSEAGLLTNGSFFKKERVRSPFLKAISVRSGYWGDFVFNHPLKVDEKERRDDIEKMHILTNALTLGINFFQKLDFFALYGKSRFIIETNASSFGGISGNRFFLETDTGSCWSVGARATILELCRIKLGIIGQYFFSNPEINRVTIASLNSVYLGKSHAFHYKEWQVGAGISTRVWRFSPYLAIKYSKSTIDLENALVTVGTQSIHLFHLQERKHFGLATGISLCDSERMQITLEARFFDETAVFINRQMRF